MTTTRRWTRERDAETPDWTGETSWWSRVYVSDDGWWAERIYSEGDRFLNRPGIAWYVSPLADQHRRDFGHEVPTLAAAKAWVDTEEAKRLFAHVEACLGRPPR